MSIEYIQGIQKKVDTNEIIVQLRSALADELIATQGYWVQSKLIQGSLKDEIQKELYQHRDEEMSHANMLMERILQLGGNPELRPLDWDNIAGCRYILNANWDQRTILDNALQSEKCATERYTKLVQFLDNRDITTYDIIHKILDDEYEHIRDLNKLRELLHDNKNSEK